VKSRIINQAVIELILTDEEAWDLMDACKGADVGSTEYNICDHLAKQLNNIKDVQGVIHSVEIKHSDPIHGYNYHHGQEGA